MNHIARVAERLNKCWAGRPLYLDMPWFGEKDERTPKGFFSGARAHMREEELPAAGPDQRLRWGISLRFMRRTLQALADGETDRLALATLATARLRATPEQLCDAFQACTTLHRFTVG